MAIATDDPDDTPLKVPPHSLDAERSLLGGLMLDEAAWDDVASHVAAPDFYRTEHRTIFECMSRLIERKSPLDVVTISEELENIGELENVGGIGYLNDLANFTPTAANALAYAEIVRERATVRELIRVGNKIAASGFNTQGLGSGDLVNQAEADVFAITDARQHIHGPSPVQPLLGEALDRINELYGAEGTLIGAPTGFSALNKMTNGLQRADLIVVAGRPSMGKTALMMNLAEAAVMERTDPVLIFSLEMSASSLVMRMLSSLGHIDQNNIRTGKLSDQDWTRITSTITLLKDKPLFIDDTPGITTEEIRSRARRVARERGDLGMIVIDYIQLMQVVGLGHQDNRANEIAAISRGLKLIAKEFNCPVVAGSQLNRALEARQDKRPLMADLRESGAIEQDADVIMAIYRDEVYNQNTEKHGKAEIIVLKQRNGPTGMVELDFSGAHTRFSDSTPYDETYP